MPKPPRPPSWLPISSSEIEPASKRVVEDEYFYVVCQLTEAQLEDLSRIRSLISVGGDLGLYYRRSQVADTLLRTHQILHLHLGGPGSNALLYLIQYSKHVLFLAIDGHIHLDDLPPGKRFNLLGVRRWQHQMKEQAAIERDKLAQAVARLRQGSSGKR